MILIFKNVFHIISFLMKYMIDVTILCLHVHLNKPYGIDKTYKGLFEYLPLILYRINTFWRPYLYETIELFIFHFLIFIINRTNCIINSNIK